MMNRLVIINSLFLFLSSCDNANYNNERIIAIGKSIISIDTSLMERPIISDVVSIGDGLASKVLQLKRNATSYSFKVEDGDLRKPYGTDEADCILIIDTDFQDIGIRLKYNNAKDKYDILGWMTL